MADLELLDVEGPAQVHDQVQQLGQHQRVDDVALQDQQGRQALAHTVARTELMADLSWAAAAPGSSA
jgi:hypothetical protein